MARRQRESHRNVFATAATPRLPEGNSTPSRVLLRCSPPVPSIIKFPCYCCCCCSSARTNPGFSAFAPARALLSTTTGLIALGATRLPPRAPSPESSSARCNALGRRARISGPERHAHAREPPRRGLRDSVTITYVGGWMHGDGASGIAPTRARLAQSLISRRTRANGLQKRGRSTLPPLPCPSPS